MAAILPIVIRLPHALSSLTRRLEAAGQDRLRPIASWRIGEGGRPTWVWGLACADDPDRPPG